MELVEARRLTGPNLLSRVPLVLVELALGEGESADAAVAAYLDALGRMRAALGLAAPSTPVVRRRDRALMIGVEAPWDTAFAYADMSEWAGQAAAEVLAGRPPPSVEPRATEIRALLAARENPRMRALAAEAARRGIPFLWDDEAVSVGLGRGSKTFPLGAVPALDAVPWDALRSIPVALVTGTNGKTTTTRLLAHVLAAAGHVVGSCSSDAIIVDGVPREHGDCTGPYGARMVLRDPAVDAAVLETARGGILRRGLALDACDVAVLTNVSDDHLGTFGVPDVAAMAEVKWVVARAVRPEGTVVLNAADPHLVALASTVSTRVVFFADLDARDAATRARLDAHVGHGGRAIVAEGGVIRHVGPEGASPLVAVDALPLSFGGAARYNVENALGVAAAARALGVDDAIVVRALTSFDAPQNPGRGEVREVGGVTVLLDFAHNPDGIRAVMPVVDALRARRGGRLAVLVGSAGDRTDAELEGMARSIAAASPDRVIVREIDDHLRGRALGEVPAFFDRAFDGLGLDATRVARAEGEVSSLEDALAWAKPGDVIALLVHLDRAGVRAALDARA